MNKTSSVYAFYEKGHWAHDPCFRVTLTFCLFSMPGEIQWSENTSDAWSGILEGSSLGQAWKKAGLHRNPCLYLLQTRWPQDLFQVTEVLWIMFSLENILNTAVSWSLWGWNVLCAGCEMPHPVSSPKGTGTSYIWHFHYLSSFQELFTMGSRLWTYCKLWEIR